MTAKTSVELSSPPRCVIYGLSGLSGSWVPLREAARENGKVARRRTGCLVDARYLINLG